MGGGSLVACLCSGGGRGAQGRLPPSLAVLFLRGLIPTLLSFHVFGRFWHPNASVARGLIGRVVFRRFFEFVRPCVFRVAVAAVPSGALCTDDDPLSTASLPSGFWGSVVFAKRCRAGVHSERRGRLGLHLEFWRSGQPPRVGGLLVARFGPDVPPRFVRIVSEIRLFRRWPTRWFRGQVSKFAVFGQPETRLLDMVSACRIRCITPVRHMS